MLSAFDAFEGPTWSRHAAANTDGVLAPPLVQLLLHFLHLGRIESPKTAFARRVPIFVLHLLKALVQGEVVTHRVLPSIRSGLKTETIV